MDLSAPFAHPPLPARLRRLADLAQEAGVSEPDVYGAGPGLRDFEAEVAGLLGREAAAFFPTGTLAQRAALQAHRQQLQAPEGRVLLHPTSHLAHHDCLRDGGEQAERAPAEASTRLPDFKVCVVGEFSRALALSDLSAPGAVQPGDIVVVELPQRMNGGRTMAWDDLQGLAALARERGARLHMDGARLWEVQPFYDRPLREICALFHSVYVSFYKGLGALSGAMLCGDADLVASARSWRERLGGSVFTYTPQWLDAQAQLRSCVPETFGPRFAKLREVVRELSGDPMVKAVLRFEPPLPEACLVHGYVAGTEEALEAAHTHVREETGLRLWNRLRGRGYRAPPTGAAAAQREEELYFEWNMGPANAAQPTELFVTAWRALAQALADSSRH